MMMASSHVINVSLRGGHGGEAMLVETEYIERTILRCAGVEPEEFRELLNGLLAEIDWAVSANGSGYDAGSWNWYMVRFKCKHVADLLKAAGFKWEPVPKRTPDEIAEMWESLGRNETEPEQAEPNQAQDTQAQ